MLKICDQLGCLIIAALDAQLWLPALYLRFVCQILYF